MILATLVVVVVVVAAMMTPGRCRQRQLLILVVLVFRGGGVVVIVVVEIIVHVVMVDPTVHQVHFIHFDVVLLLVDFILGIVRMSMTTLNRCCWCNWGGSIVGMLLP